MLNVKYLIPEANTLHENVQRSVPEWGLSCANLKLRDDIRNRKDTDAPWSFLSPDLLWQLSFDTCRSNAGDIFHLEIYHLAPTVHSFGREKKKKSQKSIRDIWKKKIQTLLQPETAKSRSGKRLVACFIQILDQSSYSLPILESISRHTTTLPMAETFLTAVTLTWSYKICKGGNPTNFPCHLFWGITILMSNVNLMLGLKFLYCLLLPLSTERPFNSFRPPYGLSEGLCTTQATLLFVPASTARNVVAYAPLEVHYSLLLLLHRAATDPDGPHPTCLQLVALSSPALSSVSSRASHFSSLSWSFLKSHLVPQHSHCPSQHHRWCHPQLHWVCYLCFYLHHCWRILVILDKPLLNSSYKALCFHPDTWELLLCTASQSVLQLSPCFDFIKVLQESNPY